MRRRVRIAVAAVRLGVLAICFAASTAVAQDAGTADAPAPPMTLNAEDQPLDGGEKVRVEWAPSPDDATIAGYKVYRSLTEEEVKANKIRERESAKSKATAEVLQAFLERIGVDSASKLTAAQKQEVRELRKAAAAEAGRAFDEAWEAKTGTRWQFVGNTKPAKDELSELKRERGESMKFVVDKLERNVPYTFMVEAYTLDGVASTPLALGNTVTPTRQWIDGSRLYLALIVIILCGSVVYWINHARSGRPIRVRKIAGLEAVDEAVGRATEMGRPCLFIPGIQDMNDIQTIAGITVLARVAKTAAEYDAKVEVPTSRSLVMTTARETVQASFLAAGRPDAYNEDLIYYVTDEQFGYVAYLSGHMVREKPAACFYMGSFFAESLILAETGNAVGAIQVAGTAQPAQLPFFVAACDYTLIGEEFFAASAYLSGSAEELGSLKGQDLGKIIVAIGMVIGIFFATLSFTWPFAADAVEYIKGTILT